MSVLRASILRFGRICFNFELFLRTGLQPFHRTPNLLWSFVSHGRLRRRNLIDLGFWNKCGPHGLFLSPFVDKETVLHFVHGLAPEVSVPETFRVICDVDALLARAPAPVNAGGS